jgi:hypothetical protein
MSAGPASEEQAMTMHVPAVAVLGAAAILSVLLAWPGAVSAQTYGQDLPPGVLQVSLAGATPGGGPISASQTPVVNDVSPAITGRLAPGATRAEFSLLNGPRWTVTIDPATGAFSTVVPAALAPGTYALYINDALVGRFTVAGVSRTATGGVPGAAGQGAALPSAGTGLAEAAGPQIGPVPIMMGALATFMIGIVALTIMSVSRARRGD